MLTEYQMTTASGYSWQTNMAKGVTIDDAKEYFLGFPVNVEPYPSERKSIVIRVDSVCHNCGQWQYDGKDCLNECKKRGFAK